MPDLGDGLKTAIIGPLLGFIASAVVSAAFPGSGLVILFNLLSILVGIISLQNAKYWGVMYSAGYFVGLLLIKKYFMEPWEYPIYLVIIGFFIFLKLTRKL